MNSFPINFSKVYALGNTVESNSRGFSTTTEIYSITTRNFNSNNVSEYNKYNLNTYMICIGI